MSFYGEDNVITGNCKLLWDGLRNPDVRQKRDGSSQTSYNVRVAMPQNAGEIQELTQIAQKALNESEWRGQLPPGGNWPLATQCDVAKYGDVVTNCLSVGAATVQGIPPIFDVDGKDLDGPMAWGNLLYPGAIVKLLVHAYSYNNVQKGIAFGLDGIQIIDATQPKLDVGGGPSKTEVQKAFTGGAPTPSANTGYAPIDTTSAPQVVMTTKAGGFTLEQYLAQGWTIEKLVEQGYAEPITSQPQQPAAPSGPPAPSSAASSFANGPSDDTIPWS